MFELAHEYSRTGMPAYSQLQQREFDVAEQFGYGAVKHQRFVGTGYFDQVATTIAGGQDLHLRAPRLHRRRAFEDPYDHELPQQQRATAY